MSSLDVWSSVSRITANLGTHINSCMYTRTRTHRSVTNLRPRRAGYSCCHQQRFPPGSCANGCSQLGKWSLLEGVVVLSVRLGVPEFIRRAPWDTYASIKTNNQV